jgi:hypothetical protein
MLQTDVCERLTCQDRFDDIRGKRGQLQHTPDVAAVDALLFGDVLEVFELPRFQLLLPIATFELKNRLTKQTVEDAIQQYKQDRDPRELLFQFGRCMVHFAVDDQEVRMNTIKLWRE